MELDQDAVGSEKEWVEQGAIARSVQRQRYTRMAELPNLIGFVPPFFADLLQRLRVARNS